MEPMVTNRHLLELAEQKGPWVTIAMPLEGGGPLAKGDPIRYRNLLRRVEDLLEARATEPERRAAMLEPLRELGARHDVFNAGARGLVVFAKPGRIEHWHLPVSIEEVARVDDRPYLEPLIPLVTDPIHFYVVALSVHHVRLLECNRFVARELPLPEGTPKRLEDAAGWEVESDSLQFHEIHSGPLLRGTRKHRTPSGNEGNRPIFHGQGAGKDDRDVDYEKYVRDVDRGLWQAITHKGSPVVLVASEHLEPVFREHTRLPNVIGTVFHAGAEHATDAELHARALELVEPKFAAAIEQAKARLHDRLGTGLATEQIAEVVVAAAEGRVDTLFVREGAHVVGTFDAETHSVTLGDGRPTTTDLIDRASTDVFLSGGTVYRLPADQMPVSSEAAAILRY